MIRNSAALIEHDLLEHIHELIAALLSHGSAHHIIEKGLYSSPVFRISILNPEARYSPIFISAINPNEKQRYSL